MLSNCHKMTNITNLSSLDTISKRIEYLSENDPDRELFVFYQGETRDPYTSRQLFQLAGKFANRLRHQYGFQRNDIIANTLPNSPERLITDMGITLAGCTCMNGQILLADGSDFLLSARNSRCRGVIVRPEDDFPAWRLLKPYVTGDASSDITGLSCGKAPDLTSAILVSRTADKLFHTRRQPLLEDLRNSDGPGFVDRTIGPEDLLIILTTSGSTGYSKLVPKSHEGVINVFLSRSCVNDIFTPIEDIVFYSDRLLGWIGGYPINVYGAGQKRVLRDCFYNHGGNKGGIIWKAICREKCDMAAIMPLDLDSILKYIASSVGDHRKIKHVLTGGQPLKKTQLDRLLTIGEQIFVVYSSTEISFISHGIVKSGLKFQGYFNRLQNPDPNTIKCFTEDGWFNTEDIGFLDEDGNVYVMGRNKDTITHGPLVLYPAWLEAKILQHPDITEACILPVSDPVKFHNICATVKKVVGSDLNEQTLKTYCESIFLGGLEDPLTPMPKFFMIFEHFPQTATGKLDKQALRKMAEDKFGLVIKNTGH